MARKTKPTNHKRAVHKGWIFLTAFSCAAAVVVGGWYAEAKRDKDGAGAAVAQCKKDQDCVAVLEDCCACTQGGTQRALPRKEAKAYERDRKKQCGAIMCAEVMSQHPSCSQTPVCEAGMCKLGGAGAAKP